MSQVFFSLLKKTIAILKQKKWKWFPFTSKFLMFLWENGVFFFIVNVSFGERERERESTRIVEICFYNYFQKKWKKNVNPYFCLQPPTGIRPQMFKTLIGKGHPEFSTKRQQDAQEFFLHIINILEVLFYYFDEFDIWENKITLLSY